MVAPVRFLAIALGTDITVRPSAPNLGATSGKEPAPSRPSICVSHPALEAPSPASLPVGEGAWRYEPAQGVMRDEIEPDLGLLEPRASPEDSIGLIGMSMGSPVRPRRARWASAVGVVLPETPSALSTHCLPQKVHS